MYNRRLAARVPCLRAPVTSTLGVEVPCAGSASLNEHLAAIEAFVEKGQFELALNRLAAASHKTTPRAKFWDSLSKAAGSLV